MSVGADGRVTRLTSINPLPEAIDRKIQARVKGFVFEPAARGGVAQPATTTLYLTLGSVALPGGTKGYDITTVQTGPRRLANQSREGLPRDSGAGYVVTTYNGGGRVTAAEFDETASPASNPRFRRWATKLARSLKFQPETVAGIAVPDKVRIPVVFCAARDVCPELKRLAPTEGNDLGGELIASSVLKLESSTKGGPPI